ncbi:pyridoxal phosphate-dependent aminotransferase [Candidatus Gottesmanbacteria bacterium]|nr:pyridoxal phosphate-dependent aminotransferase [Candidatus Gottesmanbacteria bacterium]
MNPQILYDIFEKAGKARASGKDVIKLNVGEPEQSPPKELFKAIEKSLKSGRTTYGSASGDPNLRELLAKEHGIKPENVLIGPGSKFLIFATLKLLSKTKGKIIIPLPAWSAFSLMFKDLGINNIHYLKTTEKNNWQINISDLEKVVRGSIIITNPNNPTSTLFDYASILKICKRNRIKIIKDCAYQDLTFYEIKNKVDLENTIEIHSFSKKFCMTGFRIGYMLANSTIVSALTKFMQITISNVPLFIQDGAYHLLKTNKSFPRKVASVYKKRVEVIGKILTDNNVTFVKPNAGFYIFANIGRPSEKLCLELIDKGVAFVPGTAFGPYPNYIRISLTEDENRLKKGINILIKNLN